MEELEWELRYNKLLYWLYESDYQHPEYKAKMQEFHALDIKRLQIEQRKNRKKAGVSEPNKIMIIAVDFDGTLHDAQYPAIGNPMPDAVEVMQKLHDAGCEIVIWTCRESQEQMDMFNWLIEKKIPFDRINDNSIEQMYFYGNDSRKVFADVYIDDRNLGGLPSWREIYDIISGKVKPYWIYKMI